IEDLKSALHEVEIEHPGGDKSRAVVRLAEKAVIPNRDFAISYRTAGDAITDSVLTHTDERGNFFSMIIQPPARVKQEQVVPRELVFVLDTSGSMGGFPMETSKAMMRRAIDNLRPRDEFNIVTFAGNTSVLFPEPVANNEQNRHKALRFIDTLQGAGGTEMMKAINMALGGEHDPEKVRIVCFLTDGYVGNDMAIVGAIKEHAETTRVFSFGIGSSVNRFLMDGMAKAGRGEAHYVMSHEQAQKSADKFYERIDAPVLTDIAIDFGGLEVEEVYPKRIEDLFAAKPVVVKGRYTKAGAVVIKLKGVNAAGAFEREIPVTFDASNPENAVLASQWARAKVGDLMMRDMQGMQQGNLSDELKQEIIDLGLAYNLLTQFTSFVAVEELRITEGGKPRTIRVPVEMPQGVSYSGVFGRDGVSGFSGMGGMALSRPSAHRTKAVMPSSSRWATDSEESAMAIREEAVLERLEKTPTGDELSPADKREKLLTLKLDESLRKLAAAGGSDPVEVRVILRDFSDDAIAKLEALGFKLLAKATSVKLVVGTIPADKLEELALMEVVRRVDQGTP
ncbi:MAG TPA: VWA domain-containing protein, partial [Luteolibacter sp.]|nr:VWA domain-containing protein [Luteolibacter sp.]